MNETGYKTNESKDIWCVEYDVKFLVTQPGRINLIILCGVTILLSALTIILNGSYIMAVWKNKTLRKSKNDLYILLSLIDMCYGLSMLPVFCCLLNGFIKNSPPCYMITVFTILAVDFTTMGFTAIGAITVELYIAVFKPFVYQMWKKKNVLIKFLIISWLPLLCLSIFLSALIQLKTIMLAYGSITFVTLIYCQTKIQFYVRQHTNRCSKQKKKSAKVALQIIIIFSLCNSTGLISILNQFLFPSAMVDTFISRWCVLLAFSNVLWDTFVYGLRTKLVWKEVFRLLTCGNIGNQEAS